MNQRTVKLLASYAKESGRTRGDVKDWWRTLVEKDKERARKNITRFVENAKKDEKGRVAESIRKKKQKREGR